MSLINWMLDNPMVAAGGLFLLCIASLLLGSIYGKFGGFLLIVTGAASFLAGLAVVIFHHR
jgi:hypothetical protein